MRFGTFCSGIEAPSVAWGALEWEPVFFSEIEPFPCALLHERYPGVPNLGDMNLINGGELHGRVDLICAGTPCQSFSVAGRRGGLDDSRGSLALRFAELLKQIKPRWVLWENVPGVLSSNKGRDFGVFLHSLGEGGYGFAYRILDAQYFGVPQRRRRVFVVGYLGDWKPAAAVLFERESLQWDPGKSGNAGTSNTSALKRGTGGSDRESTSSVIAFTERTRQGGRRLEFQEDIAYALTNPGGGGRSQERCILAPTLSTKNEVANSSATRSEWYETCSLMTGRVRRLTPTECERLQGFPDGYTDIRVNGKPPADSHRFRALGNSMAVPVIKWIGQRIHTADRIFCS